MPRLISTSICALVLGLVACTSSATPAALTAGHEAAPQTQALTDTSGRSVTVPTAISRVATVGFSTTLDSLLYVVGAQDLLVNGIPPTSSPTFLAPYKVLAPKLLQLPTVESTINGPLNPEDLLSLKPDVVIASDPTMADQVQKLGIPALVLREKTERPEGIDTGALRLVRTERVRIVSETSRLLADRAEYGLIAHARKPFGDVHAAARLVDVNDFWVQLSGYRREEAVGRSPAEFMTEESARAYRERIHDGSLEIRMRFFLALAGLVRAVNCADDIAAFRPGRAWRVRACYLHSEAQWRVPFEIEGAARSAPVARTEDFAVDMRQPIRGLFYLVAPKRVG